MTFLCRSMFLAALLCMAPAAAMSQSVSDVRAALDGGNPGEARRLFEALAESEQLDENTWRGFASQLFRAGAADDAVAVLQIAAGRFPSDARFPYLAAFVLSESDRCDEAISLAEQSMYLQETADASWVLAECRYASGQQDAASLEYARYLRLETRAEKNDQIDLARSRAADDPALSQEDEGVVVEAAGTAQAGLLGAADAAPAVGVAPDVEFNPGQFESSEQARAVGLAAAASARWVEAASAFAAVIELTPSDADAWYRLGVCEALSGRTLHALRAFEGALSADPRIDMAARRARQAEARLVHEQARALDPAGFDWSAEVRDAAARDAAGHGLWLATQRAAWSAAPDADSVADSLASLGQGEPVEAMAQALGALGTSPGDPGVWLLAADLARLVSDIELSTYLLEVAIELGASATDVQRVRDDLRMRQDRLQRQHQDHMK